MGATETVPETVPKVEEKPDTEQAAASFIALEFDPLDLDLTCDEIEDDVQENLQLFEYNDKATFEKTLKKRYYNYAFDADDFIILWQNSAVRQMYLHNLQQQVKKVEGEIKSRKRKAEEELSQLVECKRNEANPYGLVPKTIKTRNVVAHDQTILHLRFCALCDNKEFATYDEAVEHLYGLEACFYKGSQPRLPMESLKCNVCNSKSAKPADINVSVFEHIASYSHAVKGISPPQFVSRQLKLSCRAALCAYYVNKQVPTHLAQQASGHVAGQASSSAFMMTGDRRLSKGEMKHHPLRLGTANSIENEDTIYKSASFQTFCMTHGMTSDQVKTLWNWQPLFLPLQHIRGKCGLCKEQCESSLSVDKSVANSAKMAHLNSIMHMNHCHKEFNEIDERLRFEVPLDVKCFILSYCHACKRGLGAWNSVLSHILDKYHKAQVAKMVRGKMEALGSRTATAVHETVI